MKKLTLSLMGLMVLSALIIIGCSKKDDSSPSNSSTSSTNSTASTQSTASSSSTTSTSSTGTTSSTSSTSSTSTTTSTSSTSSGGDVVTLDGTSYPLTVTCGSSTFYLMTGMNITSSLYCSVMFSAQPTAGAYTVGMSPGTGTCVLTCSIGTDTYVCTSGTVNVTVNSGKTHVTFTNISALNAATSTTKMLSGSFGCN